MRQSLACLYVCGLRCIAAAASIQHGAWLGLLLSEWMVLLLANSCLYEGFISGIVLRLLAFTTFGGSWSILKYAAFVPKLLQKLTGFCQGLLFLQHQVLLLYCTYKHRKCQAHTHKQAAQVSRPCTRFDRLSSSSQAFCTARPSSVLELKESWYPPGTCRDSTGLSIPSCLHGCAVHAQHKEVSQSNLPQEVDPQSPAVKVICVL